MSKKNAKKAIKMIAKKQGISKRMARAEMINAIKTAKENASLETQIYFNKSFGNATPTPEEFISKISSIIVEKL